MVAAVAWLGDAVAVAVAVAVEEGNQENQVSLQF
jgi:hypothetical protein